MENIESTFHQEMLSIYQKVKGETGYIATKFRQTVLDKGGLKAAKEWLAETNADDELFKLWKLKKLDLSMEALVLRKQYRSLFTDAEIATAKKRLSELGYTPTDS